MRKAELLVVIAVVALVSLCLGRPSGTSLPTEHSVSSPAQTPIEVPTESASEPIWTVHGLGVAESTDSLLKRLGEPVKDSLDSEIRSTTFSTSSGEVKRTEFLRDETAGLSGTILERNGTTVVSVGDTTQEVEQGLGKPMRTGQADDHVTYQYDGARVYFREGLVFGVVAEGAYVPSGR